MKFKHYATDEIVNIETENQDIVFCKEKNKYYKVVTSNNKIKLKGTSFFKI